MSLISNFSNFSVTKGRKHSDRNMEKLFISHFNNPQREIEKIDIENILIFI